MPPAVSRRQSNQPPEPLSRWPHRLGWITACAALALIWVGGNVTTYKAGMAIRDWPTTEGYWFYPIRLWIDGGWDPLLEHGHRMLAQLVLLLSIALAVAVWRSDRRKSVRRLSAAAVALLLLQAIVGGMRVVGGRLADWLHTEGAPGMSIFGLLGDDVLVRRIHGCTAPLFLSLCAAVVILTSPRWLQHDRPKVLPGTSRLLRLEMVFTAGIYLMIVIGTVLRHQPIDGGPGGFRIWPWLKWPTAGLVATWFQLWVLLKLIAAGLIAIALVWLLIEVRRVARAEPMIVRRARLLLALFLAQLILAAAAWVTNYGWPVWFSQNFLSIGYTMVQEGRLQVILTTLHAALGSLNLVVALSLSLWSHRHFAAR